MSAPPAEAANRLLTAWRGEILAGAVYRLIARRLEPREAEIMGRMAEAESGHRARLEQRMRELGIEIPDPASVRVPVWLRLQARIAPIDRLLAAREAAEDEEVDDLYKRSTGDAETDRLLREIRKEERSHSLAVADMRSGGDGAGRPPDRGDGPVVGRPSLTPQARLDRILGREKWHVSGGGWISGAIYGANDGLAAVFGIVAGVSGTVASATTGDVRGTYTPTTTLPNGTHSYEVGMIAPDPTLHGLAQYAG